MKLVCHSAFIANLKSRVDRRRHIIDQFADRKEFEIQIIEPVKHEVGAVSLWETIRHIIKNLTKPEDEYIIFCEDDHEFTTEYSKENCQLLSKKLKYCRPMYWPVG